MKYLVDNKATLQTQESRLVNIATIVVDLDYIFSNVQLAQKNRKMNQSQKCIKITYFNMILSKPITAMTMNPKNV